MPESRHEFRPDLAREIEYLLGQMPRVDRETFQGLMIENPELSDRIAEAENELFDAYAAGLLPGEWRIPFEERLLATPEGRQKLAVARRLAARAVPAKRRFWIAGAIAASLALCAGAWQWVSSTRMSQPPAATAPVEVALVVERINLQPVQRGDALQRPRVRLRESTTVVELAISESSMTLSTLTGRQIWMSSQPPHRIERKLLPPGTYLITGLDSQGQPANYYEFELSSN